MNEPSSDTRRGDRATEELDNQAHLALPAEVHENLDRIEEKKKAHRLRFEKRLDVHRSEQKYSHFKSEENYRTIFTAVQESTAGSHAEMDALMKRYSQRFSIEKINGKDELTRNGRIVITRSRIFHILYAVHTAGGCSGRDVMWPHVKHYFGLTQRIVSLYISCCEICPLKRGKAKKGVVVKPIVSRTQNERCQVDLIDNQSKPDGEYKFVLVYQDHLTKFVLLRPIKVKSAEEITKQLKSIFAIFGAPKILQSDNGREFENMTVRSVLSQWGCEFVHGKPRHSQSQGSVERANRDVEDILYAEMMRRNTTQWASLLNTVQYIKNKRYHRGIGRSPFCAMFGFDSHFQEGTGYSTLENEIVVEEEFEELLENEDELIEDDGPNHFDLINGIDSRNKALQIQRLEAGQHLENQAKRMLEASNNRIGTANGILPNWYSRNQIQPMPERFITAESVPDTILASFRANVAQDSITGGQGVAHCLCAMTCDTKKCSCQKKSLVCNSRCHKANSKCRNKL